MAREKDKYLQIRISEDLKRKAEMMATAEGKGVSEWVRDLIKKEAWKREARH